MTILPRGVRVSMEIEAMRRRPLPNPSREEVERWSKLIRTLPKKMAAA